MIIPYDDPKKTSKFNNWGVASLKRNKKNRINQFLFDESEEIVVNSMKK